MRLAACALLVGCCSVIHVTQPESRKYGYPSIPSSIDSSGLLNLCYFWVIPEQQGGVGLGGNVPMAVVADGIGDSTAPCTVE
jgi:hypothetical protein